MTTGGILPEAIEEERTGKCLFKTWKRDEVNN